MRLRRAHAHSASLSKLPSWLREDQSDKRYHQRIIDDDEEEIDLPDLTLLPNAMKELRSSNPFNDLDLECIGMCCIPKLLKSIICPTTARHSLKLLHIRQSGSDLEHRASWFVQPNLRADSESPSRSSSSDSDECEGFQNVSGKLHRFAEWAFGPGGIPSLHVIACGDFSFGGRYTSTNVLLCRRTHSLTQEQQDLGCNYRHLTRNDRLLREMVDRFRHVLEACPTDSLFRL